MKLTKEIHIDKYRVLADYKVKVAKSPFMSVLQLAKEEDGKLTPEKLYEHLMKPLSIKACDNLLIRLDSMGYFNRNVTHEENRWSEKTEHVIYELSEFGRQSIETKDFYDKRNGLLEIWVADNNEFTSKIVKVSELPYDEDSKIETVKINYDLANLIKSTEVIKLKKEAFTIDNIENQIKFLESDKDTLTIIFDTNSYTAELADFRKGDQVEKQKVVESILEKEFQNNYLQEENIIFKDFDKQNLKLIRNHKIESPFYKNTYFNSITIANIAVSPKNAEDAKKWFETLLKKRVNKYFLSDIEYNLFETEIASEFQLYKEVLMNSISRQELIEAFGEEDFYKKAKLETIDYLNY